MLSAAGAFSVSEPQWFDQVIDDIKSAPRSDTARHKEIADVAFAGHVVEFLKVLEPGAPPVFSMNPKGMGAPMRHLVLEHFPKAWLQRHVFM